MFQTNSTAPMMTKEITFNSDEYTESLKLRSDILRVPLGKKLSAADTFGEENQLHFGCFSGDHLKGCIVAKPTENKLQVKMRQMAVATPFQGKGVGKRLILDFEAFLTASGVEEVVLSARETARIFYEKLGYDAVGEPYLEQGIEHIKMQKNIKNGK